VRIVVAIGGNALIAAGEDGTWDGQLLHAREIAAEVVALRRAGHQLVLTHGNGPQVGLLALAMPEQPLDALTAMTQGQTGYLLETAIGSVDPGVPTVTLLTRVVVDRNDPAFAAPTKPVGPFYPEAQGRELARTRGWRLGADSTRGARRVVPSPTPLEIVELEAVRALVAAATIAIVCGGGGIPCLRRGNRLHGVDAVVDKDLTASLLALRLEAEQLVILTDVPAVYRGFGTRDQEEARVLTSAEAAALAPELPAGSMRPKLEAAAAYVRESGAETLVTSPEALAAELAGEAGTRIVP
jgi:carbamate kinase